MAGYFVDMASNNGSGSQGAMELSSSRVSGQIDLASKSIDIVATIMKSSGTFGKASAELFQWLGRERLSESSFIYAMTLAQDFASPNRNGSLVLAELDATASRLYGLSLVLPGALGRTVLADPRLNWLASTQAVITKYHPGLEECTEAMRNLFVSKVVDHDDFRRPVYEARVQPVVKKLVESIALHTTNVGSDVQSLPNELSGFSQHLLAPQFLAETLSAVQKHQDKDILIKATLFVTDLLAWILSHWQGRLSVAVENKTVYQEMLGTSGKEMMFIVDKKCDEHDDCHDPEHVGSVTVGLLYHKKNANEQSGEVFCQCITDPGAGTQKKGHRYALYDIRNPLSRTYLELNRKEINTAVASASSIIKALMHMKMAPPEYALGLKISTDAAAKEFSFWTARIPALLQRNTDDSRMKATMRSLFNPQPDDETDVNGDNDIDITHLCRWYPELEDAMKLAGERCECGCEPEDLGPDLPSGCLRSVMCAEIVLLVGHAMIDAAGAPDISNLQGDNCARSIIDATIIILENIAQRGVISWRHWFKLAASAITGLQYDIVDETANIDVGGELIGWTAGSMTVVPSWFRLEEKINVKNSWGVSVLKGSIHGVQAEKAVLESQWSSAAKPSEIPTYKRIEETSDDMPVEVYSSIIASTDDLYRLMTIVATSSSIRVFNVADMYHGHLLAVRPKCEHGQNPKLVIGHSWSLDQIIQGWNSWAAPDGQGPHFAISLSNPLQQNIAVGLAAKHCALQDRDCCLPCLALIASQQSRVGISCQGERSRKRLAMTSHNSELKALLE